MINNKVFMCIAREVDLVASSHRSRLPFLVWSLIIKYHIVGLILHKYANWSSGQLGQARKNRYEQVARMVVWWRVKQHIWRTHLNPEQQARTTDQTVNTHNWTDSRPGRHVWHMRPSSGRMKREETTPPAYRCTHRISLPTKRLTGAPISSATSRSTLKTQGA
jgi:hypothetical protein